MTPGVAASGEPSYELWDEENRTESVLARNVVENVLLKEKGVASAPVEEHHLHETGSRYIVGPSLPALQQKLVMKLGVEGRQAG